MRRNLVMLIGLSILGAGACSDKTDGAGSHTFRLLWPSKSGKYEFRNVKVSSLEDVSGVRGKDLKVYLNPEQTPTKVSGKTPSAKFSKGANGVLIPTDSFSHQMVAAYAHIERLRKMAKLGDPTFKANSPSMIVFHESVRTKDNQEVVNNAFYSSSSDTIILIPFIGESKVPTSMNAGILGHEFYHSIFAKYVSYERPSSLHNDHFDCAHGGEAFEDTEALSLEDSTDSPISTRSATKEEAKVANQLILGALNEGLADVWGALYSNDPVFMKSSFPKDGKFRSLKGEALPAVNEASVLNLVRQTHRLRPYLYVIGTRLARWHFGVFSILEEKLGTDSAKKIMSRHLMEVTNRFGMAVGAQGIDSEIIPMGAFYDALPEEVLSEETLPQLCEMANAISLNERVKKESDSWRENCPKIIKATSRERGSSL